MYLKEHIKNLRASHGLSQSELAKKLDVSTPTIKRIESGKSKHPGKKLLSNIAKFENKTEVEILTNLLFTKEGLNNKDYILCYKFIAYMFKNNWNIINTNPIYNNYEFAAKICKRDAPIYNALVNSVSHHIISNPEKNMDSLLFEFIKPIIQINSDIKKYYIVFDLNSEQEVDIYYSLKHKKLNNLKTQLILSLFDSNNYTLIEEYNLN